MWITAFVTTGWCCVVAAVVFCTACGVCVLCKGCASSLVYPYVDCCERRSCCVGGLRASCVGMTVQLVYVRDMCLCIRKVHVCLYNWC